MVPWNFAAVWDGIAQEVPDREALVCGDRRLTWGQFAERAHRLAAHLQARGLVAGDKVAIALPNCTEYLEVFYGALLLGCVPLNVNFRSTTDEIHHVLDNSDAKAVVHSSTLAKSVATAIKRIPKGWRPFALEVGEPYERALATATLGTEATRAPSDDDLVFLYTDGTTGMPKGVMWRNEDLYVGLWVQAHPNDTSPPDPIAAARADKRAGTRMPVCPLMHGTGLFTTLATLAGGGTIVLIDDTRLDVEHVWDVVEREQVHAITIVGDVFARPMLDALVAHPDRWDLSALRSVTSSGVSFSPGIKHALLEHLPGLTIIDTLGASEGMGPSNSSRADGGAIDPSRFRVSERVAVLDERTGEPVTPGSDQIGLVAMGGHIPVGYYNDPEKTAATFRVVNGVRYAVPGDYATVAADGTVQLLGRGSASVNTGGEKVYPEEVESVVRKHKGVFDCAIVGVPDPRFGETIVGVVQVTPNHYLDGPELTAFCRRKLASSKMPRAWIFVDSLERSAAGKVDHPKLRALAMERLGLS